MTKTHTLNTEKTHNMHQHKSGTYFDHKGEIHNVVKYDMPKITLRDIVTPETFEKEHTIRELQNDSAFEMLIYHFNKFYETNLDIQKVVELRYNFKKFRNFIEQLIIRGKLKIDTNSSFNFVDWLDYLDDKGDEGTRGLGHYYDLLFEKTYLDQGIKISKHNVEIKEALRPFKIAYEMMLKALEDEERERSNGERKETCFEHLTGTMEILLRELPNPTVSKAVKALLHDAQEDLGMTHKEIAQTFGEYIAEGVDELSKKDWFSFLNEHEQKLLKTYIEPIIGELKDQKRDIMQKRFGINQKEVPMFTLLRESKTKRDILKHTEKEILKILQQTQKDASDAAKNLIKTAKERRAKEYFGGLEKLSDDDFAVKCADRLHNLRTLDGLAPKKVVKKIRETEKYFLKITEKRLPEAYKLMKKEIVYIKKYSPYKKHFIMN